MENKLEGSRETREEAIVLTHIIVLMSKARLKVKMMRSGWILDYSQGKANEIGRT